MMKFRPQDEDNSDRIRVGTIVQRGPFDFYQIIGYTNVTSCIALLSLETSTIFPIPKNTHVEVVDSEWLTHSEVNTLLNFTHPDHSITDFHFMSTSEVLGA